MATITIVNTVTIGFRKAPLGASGKWVFLLILVLATITTTLRSSRRAVKRTFSLTAGAHALTARRLAGRDRLARGRYTLTVRAGDTTRVVRFRV